MDFVAAFKWQKLGISIVYQLVCLISYEDLGNLVSNSADCPKSTLKSLWREGRKAWNCFLHPLTLCATWTTHSSMCSLCPGNQKEENVSASSADEQHLVFVHGSPKKLNKHKAYFGNYSKY